MTMQDRLRDYIVLHDHSLAQQLRSELEHLEGEIESGKNWRTIQDHVQRIKTMSLDAGRQGVMHYDHADDLKDRCDEIIQDLRKLG